MSKIHDMKSPLTGGKVELKTEDAQVEYRGETICYTRSFYRCADTGFEYVDADLDNANLQALYDTYRKNHGIPLAEELAQARLNYGIPASAMSIILGLGENQYGLYENGVVPSISVGNLLALALKEDNMLQLLLSAKSRFSEKLFRKYYSSIEKAICQKKTYDVEFFHYSECEIEKAVSFPSRKIALKDKLSTKQRTEAYNSNVFAYAA